MKRKKWKIPCSEEYSGRDANLSDHQKILLTKKFPSDDESKEIAILRRNPKYPFYWQSSRRLLQCNLCGETGENLPLHISQNHPGPVKCNFCGEIVGNLRTHMFMTHRTDLFKSDLRPVQCNLCGETVGNLPLHMCQNHRTDLFKSDLRPVQCDFCGETVGNLQIHVKQIHPDRVREVITCPQCPLQVSVKNLQRHLQKVHIQIPCPLCSDGVAANEFEQHMVVNHTRITCPLCSDEIAARKFEKHMKDNHGEGRKPTWTARPKARPASSKKKLLDLDGWTP